MERELDAVKVIFHADDFGASKEVTDNIMDVYKAGKLDSVSLLPNSSYTKQAIEIIRQTPELKCSIHFNITEGKALSAKEEIPLLVNESGMFNVSFFKILIKSYLPGRKKLKEQIKKEISRQFEEITTSLPDVRIDSHQHFHMIPVVLDCILEVVRESGREIDFIRVPAEPLIPFFRHLTVLRTIKPINLIKNLVLNTLAVMDAGKLGSLKAKSACFVGMCLSCEMDYDRVNKILPDMIKIAKKRGLPLEILAHPGGCDNPDELMDPQNELCREFYLSKMRKTEKDMFLRLE